MGVLYYTSSKGKLYLLITILIKGILILWVSQARTCLHLFTNVSLWVHNLAAMRIVPRLISCCYSTQVGVPFHI